VFQLLPPQRVTTVRARALAASETEVARSDAVIFVVDETRWARSLATLPFASTWTRLDKRRGSRPEEPWLVSRLPTNRQTLGVVGRCRADIGAFERLTLAARLVRQALQPGVTSLRVFVTGFPSGAAEARSQGQTKNPGSRGQDGILRRFLVISGRERCQTFVRCPTPRPHSQLTVFPYATFLQKVSRSVYAILRATFADGRGECGDLNHSL